MLHNCQHFLAFRKGLVHSLLVRARIGIHCSALAHMIGCCKTELPADADRELKTDLQGT